MGQQTKNYRITMPAPVGFVSKDAQPISTESDGGE